MNGRERKIGWEGEENNEKQRKQKQRKRERATEGPVNGIFLLQVTVLSHRPEDSLHMQTSATGNTQHA